MPGCATSSRLTMLVLVLTGVALTLRTWHVALMALLTIALQILTAPVAAPTVNQLQGNP